jgi:hypothetical protein
MMRPEAQAASRMISNRDLFAKEHAAIDLKGILHSAQLGEQAIVQVLFIVIELFFVTIVRLPPHALGLWRELPVLGLELTDRTQLRIDP